MSNFNNPWDEEEKKPSKSSKPDDFDKIIEMGKKKINNMLGNNGGRGGTPPELPTKTIFSLGFVLMLVIWFASGFYILEVDQEGVVMRLGRYVRTSEPGLNYKLPFPIETVEKISVTRINKESIGFVSSSSSDSSSTSFFIQPTAKDDENSVQTVAKESQMLTGDENIVDINFDVQWKIINSKDYLFNIRDLSNENTVKSCAESAMREVIGVKKISEALAEDRFEIEKKAKTLLQKTLDNYKMGVEIVRLQMLKVQPPVEVIDAYRDVQSAKADKEKSINEGYAYRNSIIPIARGEAQRKIQDAEGYKSEVIAKAQGEANRFNSVLNQYVNAKEVTKKRIYLETMEEILSGADKIIMQKDSNAVPYLPLNELLRNKEKSNEQ